MTARSSWEQERSSWGWVTGRETINCWIQVFCKMNTVLHVRHQYFRLVSSYWLILPSRNDRFCHNKKVEGEGREWWWEMPQPGQQGWRLQRIWENKSNSNDNGKENFNMPEIASDGKRGDVERMFFYHANNLLKWGRTWCLWTTGDNLEEEGFRWSALVKVASLFFFLVPAKKRA